MTITAIAVRPIHGIDPRLERPVFGPAVLVGGRLTVGNYADLTSAGWSVGTGTSADHTTVIGTAKSGRTSLLRSVIRAAVNAEVDVRAIDPAGPLAAGGCPTASDVRAARRMLSDHYDLALTRIRQADQERPLQLLVIDAVDELTKDRFIADKLDRLMCVATRAGIAVLVGSGAANVSAFGGRYLDATLTRHALVRNLVLLRHDDRPNIPAALYAFGLAPAHFPPVPGEFPDGGTTAGIGYLPRQSRRLFRAWHV